MECHLLADDTTLHTTGRSAHILQQSLQSSLLEIESWCDHNCMALNPKKSSSMVVTTRQKRQLSPLTMTLSINNDAIKQVTDHTLLGVTVDENLQWKPHIERLCKKLSRNLFLLSQLKPIITLEARKVFYHAHIQSHMDYASVVWDGCDEVRLSLLNSLHRREARLIKTNNTLSTDNKLKSL